MDQFIKLDLDSQRATAKLEKFVKESGLPLRWVVADQLRLLSADLMSSKVPFPAKAKDGREAIDRDLNKLFIAVDQKPVRDFFEDDFGGGELPPATIFNFDNEAEMKRFHKSKRIKSGSRAGRVRFRGRITKRIGDLKFYNKMYVTGRMLTKYRRELRKDVGKLKAGWVNANKRLASFTGGIAKVPAWVKKQSVKQGTASISTMKKDGNGYMSITNSVPFANSKYESSGWLESMMQKRRKDIHGDLSKRLAPLLRQFNKGTL